MSTMGTLVEAEGVVAVSFLPVPKSFFTAAERRYTCNRSTQHPVWISVGSETHLVEIQGSDPIA